MKRFFVIIMLGIVLVMSCTKEDNISPIDNEIMPDTTSDTMDYCVIENDTIRLSRGISFMQYDKIYYFYDNTNQLVIELMEMSDCTIPCLLYYKGDKLTFYYTIVTSQLGDTSMVSADGTCVTDSSIHFHLRYRGGIINMNQSTGMGWLDNGSDSVEVSQLSYRGTLVGNYYELCNAQDYGTYSLGRIRIWGDLHSGLYELENNAGIQVLYEKGIPGTCPGVTSYPVTKGTLQFSNNDGQYAIILHGETEYSEIEMDYQGFCFNTTGIPLSW